MTIFRALLGGFLGGGIGAYLVEQLPDLIGVSGAWTILLAGLLAGIGARIACGSERSFGTGMAGAIAAILAISGVSYWTSLQRSTAAEQALAQPSVLTGSGTPNDVAALDLDPAEDEGETPTPDAAPETSPESPEPGGADAIALEPDRLVDRQPAVDPWADGADGGGHSTNRSRQTLPISLALFHSLSALLAFVLGSGAPAPDQRESLHDQDPAQAGDT